MLTPSFAFAVLCFALLLLFFSGLPNLNVCQLPQVSCFNEPDRQNRLAVMLVTLLYAICTFWNLGNTSSPQTFVPMEGNVAVIALREDAAPARLVLFPGVGQGYYRVEYSDDADGWYPITEFEQDHVAVLKWQYLDLNLPETVQYLRLVCASGNPWLGEVSLRSDAGDAIAVICSFPELTDEQELVPVSSDYRNSSYFDEIYHARTAWEHLHNIWPYEVSHPPLGKELLSLGILIFGMTPFGWRFSGTMAGALMLPLMYRFLRRLYGEGRESVLGTVLLASGFMHYVQTRIATVDSYAVLFILLMYFFMLGWLREGKLSDLALCGVSFGFGAATKWICLYAGAGLAVLWLGHWLLEFRSEKCGMPGTDDPLQSVSHSTFLSSRFFRNAAFCILFFVLIPGLIYYLSYLPYGRAQEAPLFSSAYTKLVLENQTFMFSYHANIKAEHPYASRWYQWVLNIRPILYYLEYFPDGKRASIAAFVNPFICWGGLLSLPVLCWTAVRRRDRTAAFLLVAYASGLVPWMFISRLTFEYHYFASATFLVPAVCYVFYLMDRASSESRFRRFCPTAFTIAAVVLFAWFFPVLNGLKIPNELGSRLLGWLPSWPI